MPYRNGTYIAFHADGTNVPGRSDIKYYNLMKAWTAKGDDDFTMINSHDKACAVRDTSKRETLRTSLLQRLRNSKNMVLIVGDTTRFARDWVPLEIKQAVDKYELPIIAAYTGYECITAPAELRGLWPEALESRIYDETARVIHIPFKKEPLKAAIDQFDLSNPPTGALNYYIRDAYVRWGLIER